jgi:hypothetical protein
MDLKCEKNTSEISFITTSRPRVTRAWAHRLEGRGIVSDIVADVDSVHTQKYVQGSKGIPNSIHCQ